ncbi:unnamed protein product [Lactuca saligna]|uniref:DUF4408 domain-containing protein n=1 Tax=Lactuca saligna TaxID=75948 RepID=A0AA35YZQ5_LACSI|nr:unnamed protein product [Lactuca saligna]
MHPKHMEVITRNVQLQAVLFTAGTAVVFACLERAVVVSIFKQWHMWVFLALNLLLIAILFTSTHPPQNSSNPPSKSQETNGTRKTEPPPLPAEANHHEDIFDEDEDELKLSNEESEESNFEEEEKSSSLFSNDELNERVEAFISRFRQQYLVSDVKISRTRSENVCTSGVFSKTITV